MLGMAYIRVLEVATFYTQFLLKPVGTRGPYHGLRHDALHAARGRRPDRGLPAQDRARSARHFNADGTLSWEEVECLGACVNAPMIMIGDDTYEDLTVESFEEIVEAFRAGKGKSIKPGPQIDAHEFGCRGRPDDAARSADRRADLQADAAAATAAGPCGSASCCACSCGSRAGRKGRRAGADEQGQGR